MWSHIKVFISVILVAVALNGCAVDIADPPSSATATSVVISTSRQGAQVVSQVNQAKELVYNSTAVLKSLGSAGLSVIVTDPTVTLTAPVACADYGDYTYTGSVNASGTYTLDLTFKLCRMDGYQFDGAYTLTGTPTSMNITLGSTSSAFRVVQFNGNNYSAIIGTLSMLGMRYTMSGGSSGANETYTIMSNGIITAFDYIMLGEFSVGLSGLTVNYSSSIDAVTKNKMTTMAVNGRGRETWTSGSVTLTYTNFSVSKLEYFSSAGPPTVYSGSDTTVDGTVAFDFSPSTYGNEGIVSVSTSTVGALHHNYTTGKTTQGIITVSGTGSATAQFNSGGGLDVAAPGDAALHFGSEYYLNSLVNIYGIEQALPEFKGAAGAIPSAGAAGSRWSATMTVTALSSGPDLNCYTDVHVLYYNPADLLVPQITWYVDWNIGLVNSCSPPPGIPFEEARDIGGDSSCDVGLDINGSAFDITSGGVEHFTATALPEGYYIISINNYSCADTTTNMASIIIGDYLFGSYNCSSYTASDGDGSMPGAWCRLADVRVNADSSVDVLTPNPSYNPWH